MKFAKEHPLNRHFNKKLIASSVAALSIGAVLGIALESSFAIKNIYRRMRTEPQTVQTGKVPEEYQGKLKLFILAGQSNMAGMGDLPRSQSEPNPRIYVFSNDYHWRLAKEPVDDPQGQVDRVSEDRPAGYGPAVSFASTLLKHQPEAVIGLIPCAKGGSSIHEWRRDLNDDTLYGSCLKRVQAASVMGKVAGLLYFQGEIDAIDPTEMPTRTFLPHQWAERFTVFVQNWRSDLNLPGLPVVFAQIGSHTEPKRFIHWDVVRAQQHQVQLPHTAMITTDDLPLKDYVHFTTESYEMIGQRFGEAYLKLSQTANKLEQKSDRPSPNPLTQ